MAESKPYTLPNTQGRYVTVSVTNLGGEVYRLNDDGTRTIYADYFVENGNTILESSTFSSEEFQRNLAQNSQGYNRTIGGSILDANKQTNSQPDPNQPNVPGGSTPANPNQEITEETENKTLIYPEDLASSGQDRIKFLALIYSSTLDGRLPGLFEGGFALNRPKFTPVEEGPVFLPIQSSITDQNSVGWEPDTMNPIEVRAATLSSSIMKNPLNENITKAVGDNLLNALKELKKQDEAVRAYLVGQAIGVNNLQSRLLGQVLNPNLELLFQGPQLRPFTFTFKLSPRSSSEAKIVKRIINYFKRNMAAQVAENGLFLRAPNVFKIEYQKGTSEHKSINLIKECALTNCAVDYTPLGTYMTFNDEEATMVSYTLNLQFQELEPIYSKDYINKHPIGF
jgi:hypothetical protein